MSRLDDIMTNVGLPALRKQLGDDAVYTPPGGSPVATWAMMSASMELVGQYSPVAEPRATAELPVADVPDPKIGASLVVNGSTYRVGQVIANDGYTYTVTVALT